MTMLIPSTSKAIFTAPKPPSPASPSPLPAPCVAVLWDVDGTLVDSDPVHHACIANMLKEWGYTLTQEEYFGLVGVDTEMFFKMYSTKCKGFPHHRTAKELAEEASVRFAEKVADVLPREGVISRITKLKTWGIPMTCASSGKKSAVLAVLNNHPTFHSFIANSVTLDDTINGKPDPEPYVKAAFRLGVDASRCVVVEDSPAGAKAGKLAGCIVIAWPQHKDLVFTHYDYLVESLDEVPWARLFGKE